MRFSDEEREYWAGYWEQRIGSGWIRRYGASPAFEAGAVLLAGAARLWIGRYGAGRLVGQEALGLSSRMWDLGQHWREAAVNRTATFLPPEATLGNGGYLLAKFRDRRTYRPKNETAPAKHQSAARCLAQAALTMASDRLQIIRETGRDVGDYGKDANLWEDRLEKLGETSLGLPPDAPLSSTGRTELESYAVYRACEGFAASVASILNLRENRDRTGHIAAGVETWSGHSCRFGKLAEKAYAAFARDRPDGAETAALLDARDDAMPYVEFGEFHYHDATDMRGAAAIAALYVSLLLWSLGADAAADWDGEMLARTLAAVGIKKLPAPRKALSAGDKD